MSVHRFRDQIRQTQPNPAFAGALGCAFVPCPMFQACHPMQQVQIQEIYRLAAERTREQLRPTPSRIPQFSLN